MPSMVGAAQAHPDTEDGNPLVDMQAMMPTSRLDDPGIGLRNNGRRVLTYADLKSLFDDPDGRVRRAERTSLSIVRNAAGSHATDVGQKAVTP